MAADCKNYDPKTSSACQYVKDDGSVCGEPKTFGVEIIDEFNRIYENRLGYIDKEIGGDCAELKYPIYKDWVRDLIAQNKTFIQVLDELEREASHRFELLETKLKNDMKEFGGDSRFKKLENDLRNLLVLIHRALETNKWNVEGLEFQTISMEDIFGKFLKINENAPKTTCKSAKAECDAEKCISELKAELIRLTHELKRKECVIEEFQGRCKNLQLDCKPSCESVDSKSELESKFKLYIEELKDIIKEKDAKNSLLNKENENLKLSISKNAVNENAVKKKELETETKETKPSETELHICCLNCICKDSDWDNNDSVEKSDKVSSDLSVCNRLNKEINDLLTQIRARESHISNQNTIICNFQEKLNETRLQLKLITCERDQVSNKLSIIESELENMKEDITQCAVATPSDCDIKSNSSCPKSDDDDNDDDGDPCKKEGVDKKLSVILHLKPMVNNMREKIVTLNRENCTLKASLEECKESLSESQCEILDLKKKLTAKSNKSYANKEVLAKFKCNVKDSPTDTEWPDLDQFCSCCSSLIEKKSKRKEKSLQRIKSIFKEFLCTFGVEIAESDLDRVANCDKKCIDKLVERIKETLQPESASSSDEKGVSINQLKDVLNIRESEIFDLKCKLTALNVEAENCNQTMQLNEDKVKILSEERDRLDLECKNQFTTIENLREALEMVKRGHNIASPSYDDEDVTILSEQLSSCFEDNMKLERHLDLIRDENLELKRQLFDLENDYASLEMKQQKNPVVRNRREKSIYKLLKKDLDQLKNQSTTIQSSLCNRESELKKLKYFRDKCLEMEINSRTELEMQKSHYTKIINELHEELASLSDQLAEQQKESLQQNDLINDTSALENSISEIENQNDILQKTLCSYESRLADSVEKCNKLKSERNRLKCDLECFKNEVGNKDNVICELKLEIDKLKSQLATHDNYPKEEKQNRPTSSSGYDTSRALDIIKRLNCEMQCVKKAALEEKNCLSQEIDEYCGQILKLKNKICCLENLAAKREKEVESLNEKMLKIEKRASQLEDDLYKKASRVGQLEREDFKLREIVNKLSLQLSETKKDTQCNEKHLLSELNCFKEKVDEQKKVIKCLKQQYDKVHEDMKNLKTLEEAINKENTRLMKENREAKDQIASFEGRGGQISNLLSQTQEDLQKQKDEVNRLKQVELEFNKLREQNCKIYQHNCEMTKKIKNSECEYEKLTAEYKKLLDVKEQALAALKTARAWQTENCEREKLIKLKLQKNTEHIQMLTKDRKQLVSKMNQMHRDELILRSEIDVLKEKLAHCRCSRKYAFTDTENSGSSRLTRVDRYSSDPEVNNEDPDDRCLKSVKQTAKKIYRTRKFWQNGIKDACE